MTANTLRLKAFNKTYGNMAEHWTLQDTSIITDATPKQRARLINNLLTRYLSKKLDKSTVKNSRLKILIEWICFNSGGSEFQQSTDL